MRKIFQSIFPRIFQRQNLLLHSIFYKTNSQIYQGPFKGMQYVSQSIGSKLLPKILGTYEYELHHCIERICKNPPPLIIDIGAAEGYYAIGMAIRNPNANIIAFEMDECGRKLLYEMALNNDVSNRVSIYGKCNPHDLSSVLKSNSNIVIICDTEGYEHHLLDPKIIPELKQSTILVELHDFIVPGITDRIKMRFFPTHNIEEIFQKERSSDDFPWENMITHLVGEFYLRQAVCEGRPVIMNWLFMEPL